MIQISQHHHHTGEEGNGLESGDGDHSENYILVKMHYKDKKKSFGEIRIQYSKFFVEKILIYLSLYYSALHP